VTYIGLMILTGRSTAWSTRTTVHVADTLNWIESTVVPVPYRSRAPIYLALLCAQYCVAYVLIHNSYASIDCLQAYHSTETRVSKVLADILRAVWTAVDLRCWRCLTCPQLSIRSIIWRSYVVLRCLTVISDSHCSQLVYIIPQWSPAVRSKR